MYTSIVWENEKKKKKKKEPLNRNYYENNYHIQKIITLFLTEKLRFFQA